MEDKIENGTDHHDRQRHTTCQTSPEESGRRSNRQNSSRNDDYITHRRCSDNMADVVEEDVGHLGWTPRPKATIANLTILAKNFFTEGLAPLTRQTYAAGQQRFWYFCTSLRCYPAPSSENILVLFATHLVPSNISHTTIKVAIRQLHVSAGLHEQYSL